VIDCLNTDYFSPRDPGLFRAIVESLLNYDEYMLLADYQAYLDAQDQVSLAYKDQTDWTRKSILNVARMGKFSSDRTIDEYCKDIWQVEPMPISLQSSSLLEAKSPTFKS
jgi:glycogen phosphorylase